MEKFFILSLACAGISFTVTWTSIFGWLRESVSKIHPKAEELIHCPWCFNHYVSLAAMLLSYRLPLTDFIATWFAMVAVGGLIHYVLLRAYQPVLDLMKNRAIEKRRKED